MPTHRIYKVGDIQFRMVDVPGGILKLKEREIELSPFRMGQHLVSQDLWQLVMGRNSEYFRAPSLPMDGLSWCEAVEFCNQLSERCKLNPVYTINKYQPDPNNENKGDILKWTVVPDFSQSGFRLPREAEWIYAARGGPRKSSKNYTRANYINYIIRNLGWYDYNSEEEVNSSKTYAGGNYMQELGWYNNNSEEEGSRPCGLKKANHLGLYDLSGNTWEHCWDEYDDDEYWDREDDYHSEHPKYFYPSKLPKHSGGPNEQSDSVLRGGDSESSSGCRLDNRESDHPYLDFIVDFGGLRLAQNLIL